MSKYPFLPKRWHILALIMLAIGAVLCWGLTSYARQQILDQLGQQEGLSCSGVHLNLWSACVDLTDFVLLHHTADSLQYHVESQVIHFHGLSYWQYLRKRKFVVQEVSIEGLQATVKSQVPVPTPPKQSEDSNKSRPDFSEIVIKQLLLQQGKLNVEHKGLSLQLDTINVQLEGLTYQLEEEDFSWKSVAGTASSLLLDHHLQHNVLQLESLALTPEQGLRLNGIHWQPRYPKHDFVQHLSHRKARVDLKIPQLLVAGFSLRELLYTQRFYARHVLIEGAWLEAFSDRSKAKCTSCPKDYFYEKIAAADWPIRIDSVQVKNSHIVYEERESGGNTPGQLEWTQLYASLYQVTNQELTQITIDIQTQFQDEAQVALHFTFPAHDPSPNYHFEGSLANLDLKQINHFLTFSKRLKIKDGQLKRLDFSGQGNLQEASGEMELRYRDLNIELLDSEGSARKVVSVLANSIISQKNNPDRNDQLRRGQMFSRRIAHKSFLGNWWWCLQTGIKSTVLPNLILPDELDSEKQLVDTAS